MSLATLLTFIYGILSIGGGIVGFRQANSRASLIAGLVTGVLLLVAGVAMIQAQDWGALLAIATTALLVIVFVGRLAKTKKLLPAGLMVVTGIFTLVALAAVL
jgi:uncharacterized membrane protein (UPF0136 family)